MADDELPPDGLFYEDHDDDSDGLVDDRALSADELVFSDEEIAAIRRLEVVRRPDGTLPTDGASVLAFRNSHGEPVVVPTAVATEAERALRAYKAHVDGADWLQIAIDENYPSPTAAKADVDRYLSEGRALVVEKSAREMLELELTRLNRYTFQLRDMIEKGSIVAITEARHLVMARARLAMALGAALNAGDTGSGRTVVVAGDEHSFVATLREAAGDELAVQSPTE